MIKRNGVEVMNERTVNVAIAKETLAILKKKEYTAPSGKVVNLSKEIDFAVQNTVIHEGDVDQITHIFYKDPVIEVTNETTSQAAVRLAKLGKTNIVALNFASAKNPGGGFISGALAQEEDLCRASGLYVCTKSKPMFYNRNILCEDTFYTDDIIYSPNVPFFRDDHNIFLEEPYLLSIVSSPAPNIRSLTSEGLDSILDDVFTKRTMKILEVASRHYHKNIVLGAWGCGAFGNDPKRVAASFMKSLKEFPVFEHVCFAVYDTREPPVLYETFKEICK